MSLFNWSTIRAHVQLLLLILVAISAFYGRTMLLPLQEVIRVAMRLSDDQMALLQGPPIAIGVTAAMPLGVLSDRYSRARLIVGFALLAILANLLSAWAPTFALLFVARCLAAVSASAIWTAVLSLVADWYAPVRRGRATTSVAIGAVVGMSCAFALGGVLLTALRSQVDIWRWAMLGLGAPLIVVLLVTLALQDPPHGQARRYNASSSGTFRQLWLYRRRVLPFALGFALVGGIADGAVVIWAGPMFTRKFEFTSARVGTIMASILLINGVLGPVVGGALADFGQRTGGPHRTMRVLIVLLSLSIPLGCFALVPTVLSASILLGLFLICGTAFSVALMTLTTIVVPNYLRASCLAFLLAISNLFAYGVAPLLVSHLSTLMGEGGVIEKSLTIVCVVSSALGGLVFWFVSRARRPSRATEASDHDLAECSE
jgi:MFS family permease